MEGEIKAHYIDHISIAVKNLDKAVKEKIDKTVRLYFK